MCHRRWFTSMVSSGISSAERFPRVLADHEADWIYRKGGRPLLSSTRAKKCKETGAVASVEVFEAGALGWYLKPQSNEVDASGCAKGNHN